MGGIRDLLANDKGILAILIIVAATILAGLGTLTIADWKTAVTTIFGFYAGATALHGSALAFANRHKPIAIQPAKVETPVEVKPAEVAS